eukprot:scaffold28674_cov104-Isochrysis_galbana.AAC.2
MRPRALRALHLGRKGGRMHRRSHAQLRQQAQVGGGVVRSGQPPQRDRGDSLPIPAPRAALLDVDAASGRAADQRVRPPLRHTPCTRQQRQP